jgi:hypothetical protein
MTTLAISPACYGRYVARRGHEQRLAVKLSPVHLALALAVIGLTSLAAGQGPAPPTRPGVPAPAPVVEELQTALGRAVQRFEARDVEGVLGHISEQYRTGPLTKTALRAQLAAMFGIYEAMRARVRIDEVRLVGDQAWVWSTGEATGRLPFLGQWMTVFTWDKDLEIARREGGAWRLYGYQQ